MTACTYLSLTGTSTSMAAKEFGYFAVKWSGDHYRRSLSTLAEPPWGSIPAVRTALDNAFKTSLFLISFHTAAQWMFAAGAPTLLSGLPTGDFTDTLRELQAGTADATRELTFPNGKRVSVEVAAFVAGLTGNFFQDMLDDLSDAKVQGKNALPRLPSRSADRFFGLLDKNLGVAVHPHEAVVLGPVLDILSNATREGIGTAMTVSFPR